MFLVLGVNYHWYGVDEEPEAMGHFLYGEAYLDSSKAHQVCHEAVTAFCEKTTPQAFPIEFERYSALADLYGGDTDQITWADCFNAGFGYPYEVVDLTVDSAVGNVFRLTAEPAPPAEGAKRALQLRR